MKLYKQYIYVGLVLSFFLRAQTGQANHYGIAPLSEKEQDRIENKIPKVIKVEPNNLAKARSKQKNHSPKSVAPSEFGLVLSSTNDALNQLQIGAALPSSVNNTTLPSFPPIGDQGRLGACVAFGSTYYQATHELGLLNGNNNKTSSAKILSPKWTYNLLNDGSDRGLIPSEAYLLLNSNGAVSWQQFPYDSNYTAWELDSQDWVAALYNRFSPAVLIPGLGGSSTQNLTAIKQALANGHVLTFATYIDSWVYTKIKQGPNYVNNNHVGEWAAVYMNGRQGGHFMTIVGYDDNLWIDVNNNGTVDAGEMGAFLIANSWGTNWGNQGLIWISYDAFLSASAVAGGPNSNRVAAGEYLNSSVISVVPIAQNYTPSLIAQFTLADALRNQINVQVGVSDTNKTSPTTTSSVVALATQGGNYNFAGGSGNSQATFAADLSPFLPSQSPSTNQRYYLVVNDTTSGNPTTLSSFSLVDLTHGRTLTSTQTPKTYDRSGGTLFLDYNFSSTPETGPTVSITSPSNQATVSGTQTVAASASSTNTIARVTFSVDSQIIANVTSSPYQTSINTTQLSNGSHQISATAVDSQGRSSSASVNITVQNSAPTSFYINAGGSALSSQGLSWGPDTNYITGSSTTSTTSQYTFANPIYQTARYGNMNYSFKVSNGNYFVTLKFAEILEKKSKSRVFNALVNGKRVISNLDLVKKVGAGKPYDVTIPVTVSNGTISIQFVSLKGSAQINGIQIAPNVNKKHVKHKTVK